MKDIIATSVHVLAKPNVFTDEVLETYIAPGSSLRDILGNDGNNYIITLNGEIIPHTQWELTFPAEDDHILISSYPLGDAGEDILRVVAMIAVIYFAWWAAPYLASWYGGSAAFWQSALSFAGVLVVGLVLPPTLPDTSVEERKRLNSITGTRNNFAPFAPIPNIYGKHRLYPPYASVPWTEIIGEDQYFNAIFCVGLGEYEIDGTTVKIGETLATAYEDISLEQTDAPTQPDIFEEQLSLAMEQTAEPGSQFIRTTQANTTEIGVDFVFPGGLIQIDPDDGDKHYVRVHFQVEYRESGSADPWVSATATGQSWPTDTRTDQLIRLRNSIGVETQYQALLYPTTVSARYGSITNSTINTDWVMVQARTRDPIRVGFKFKTGSSKTWDVRITRQRTQHASNGATVTTSSDIWEEFQSAMSWVSIKSINEDQTAIALPSGVATFIQMRVRATDQLNGTIDSFNVVAQRRLRKWNGATFDSPVTTRNPAWAFLDILTGLGNARAIESGDEANKILLDDLKTWADDCDTESFYYDEVIDYKTSVFEALTKAASIGRAAVTNRDGKWGVIQEQTTGSPVQYFTPRNSWGFSVTKRFVDYPHALKVRFNSEEDGYQEVERIVYDDGYNAGNATKFEVLELSGVTDPDLAWRIGRYTIASTRLRPEIFVFNADVEHIIAQRGDHILMSHDIPLWGVSYGRITGINGNQVTMDEVSVLDGGTNYAMRVRKNDGTSVAQNLTNQGGEVYTHTFTPSIPAGINVGDLCMLGEVGSETQELVIIAIEPGSDLSARITCVEANDAILTADTGGIPAYTPLITLPADITSVAPAAPYALRAQSDQNQYAVDGTGKFRPRIVVSWDLQGNAAQRWKALRGEIRYREYDASFDGGTWKYIPSFNAFSASANIENVDIGLEYEIQMRAISQYDRISPWSSAIFHTVGGATRLPPSIDALVATGAPGGIDYNVDYTSVVIKTGSYLEVALNTINDRDDVGTVFVQIPIPSDIGPLTDLDYFVPLSDQVTRYTWARLVDVYGAQSPWVPSGATSGQAATPTLSTSTLYYIKPTAGTALKNGSGQLTLEARKIEGGTDTLLSSGAIQLYVGTTLVTAANGYVAGSDGYTGIFDAGDINGDVVVELKDAPSGGNLYDTETLVDVDDGLDGSDAVAGYIESDNGLAWVRAPNAGAWTPASTTIDLDCTFVQAGAEVARIARRITLNTSDGTLTVTTVAHAGGDLNTSRVTVTISGASSSAVTIKYDYSFGGENGSVTQTVYSAQSGQDGDAGSDGYNTATLTAFKRSASAPGDNPGAVTYTFSTAAWTPANGWSKTVPAGNDPLYVVTATAYSNTATDNVGSGEWSSPVILAEDGADGSNGLNVASAFIYQRTKFNSPPTLPSVSATYTFATGAITGLNNGWTDEVPAPSVTDRHLWVSTATASNTASTDSIGSGEWATPRLMSIDGKSGGGALNSGWAQPVALSDWWSDSAQTTALGADWSEQTEGTGPLGDTVIEVNESNTDSDNFFSERVPCDVNKQYTAELYVRQPSGNRLNYLLVAFYDSSGNNISSATSDATGWDGIGTYHYWSIVNAVFPTAWTKYEVSFGGDSDITIPTGAVTMAIGGLFSRDGTTSTQIQFQGYGVFEVGNNGRYKDIKYKRSGTQPATPTGNSPAGWFDSPPAGNTALWQSVATKTANNGLIGAWSTPEIASGMVYRGNYNAGTAYVVFDVVTYNGRTFICLQSTTGNAPPDSNGSNTYWDLMAAQGDPGDPPSSYTSTINVPTGGGQNLRTLANTDGYNGVDDATLTFNLAGLVTGSAGSSTGGAGGKGIDFGSWPASATISITLNLNSGADVRGGGGGGGKGGSNGPGNDGGDGGTAIDVPSGANIDTCVINVNSGSNVRAGGGGGGGGGSKLDGAPEFGWSGGGGGGGGYPNGSGGEKGDGELVDKDGTAGNPGTTGGGGSGGSGHSTAGSGGAGGGVNTNGSIGNNSTSSVPNQSGGSGGTKGNAIDKNGNTVTVNSNGGTITGTVAA